MKMIFRIARSRIVVGTAVLSLFAIAGCGGDDKEVRRNALGSSAADAPSDSHANAPGGTTLAGVSFTAPAQWQDLGANGMRKAQYRLAPVAGDAAPGEVNIFYFGPASGGGVEANLNRWIGQMVLPDGSDPAAGADRATFTANGMPGHIVSLNGTYKSGGGRPMGGTTTLLAGYRLVGVVIEGPEGSLFFKLTGPLATAQAMERDLVVMVKEARARNP